MTLSLFTFLKRWNSLCSLSFPFWHTVQFSSVAQSCLTLCNPMDCSTPGFPVHRNPRNLLKLTSIESVMPPNHLIFCCSLLLLPLVFPSIRVFSNESVLHIKWPKHWSFSVVADYWMLIKTNWEQLPKLILFQLYKKLPKNLMSTILASGEGNGTPLQYSCLENPTDGEV